MPEVLGQPTRQLPVRTHDAERWNGAGHHPGLLESTTNLVLEQTLTLVHGHERILACVQSASRLTLNTYTVGGCVLKMIHHATTDGSDGWV